MSGKLCCVFCICAVVILIGGCPFSGRVYEDDLGNGYAIWAADVLDQATMVRKGTGGSSSTRVVQPMVYAYGWNDDFIIAKQHPRKDLKVDASITHWYIIEVASGKVHGPLTAGEFNKLRTELKVPAGISFKTVK